MSNWIKPSELPERFNGVCWVIWRAGAGTNCEQVQSPSISMVQNRSRGGTAVFWCRDAYWRTLKDNEYRLIILDTPKPPYKG